MKVYIWDTSINEVVDTGDLIQPVAHGSFYKIKSVNTGKEEIYRDPLCKYEVYEVGTGPIMKIGEEFDKVKKS